MTLEFHMEDVSIRDRRAFYGTHVEFRAIYPAEWRGFAIGNIRALVEEFKPLPRRKIYCANLKDLPLPELRNPLCEPMVGFEICVREWIGDLELEPGIYGVDDDFLIIGPKAPGPAVVRPVRRRDAGPRKVVFSKPNRAARRGKGRKGGGAAVKGWDEF